jgi:hypothetical protein
MFTVSKISNYRVPRKVPYAAHGSKYDRPAAGEPVA